MAKKYSDPEQIKKERELTANEFTDVKDVKSNLLYTKSGYVIGYLRLFTINIDLLSKNELDAMTNTLAANFKSEKEQFSYLIIPRTVDMDIYITSLSNLYDEEISNVVRKKLLNEMITQASMKIMSGSNFEHQIYLRVWEKYNANAIGSENRIFERLDNFQNRFMSISNNSIILDDKEILKLCNLFGNSNQAVFESIENTNYIPIPMINRRD